MRCIFICLLCLCLCGCTYYAPPGEAHGSRVITSVEVTATENGQLNRYRYNTETKVRTILTYLLDCLCTPLCQTAGRTGRSCLFLPGYSLYAHEAAI